MEVSEIALQRTKFLIVLLMPVTLISIFSLFLPSWYGDRVYFLNLLVSSGDLYMAATLIKLHYESKVVDKKYGFDILVK